MVSQNKCKTILNPQRMYVNRLTYVTISSLFHIHHRDLQSNFGNHISYIDGLMQDWSNSSLLAMQLLQYCPLQSKWCLMEVYDVRANNINLFKS